MPTKAEMDSAKSRAKQTIQDTWRQIAKTHTFGWGGPIDSVEQEFPAVRNQILDIRHQISTEFPILFFQTRESPSKDTITAVPYWKDTGNPFNCRLIAVRDLSTDELKLYSDFAQAFWFSIHMKLLPDPRDGMAFQSAIQAWTGEEFFI
jgi:hypothetical protein